MKHISIIIFISLIAFSSLAFNTTNIFSTKSEKVSDNLKVSDTSNEAKVEENLPTFLQLSGNLDIKPIGLQPNEIPYKSLILINEGGLEMLRADVENGKITVKKFENKSFKTTTQTTYDINIVIPKAKYYLYTLADDGSTHCSIFEGKAIIAPLRKKSKPGWDKLANQPISDCFFTKPLNDGKSYAWKGDVKATIQKGTFDSDKGYSVSFQVKFDKLPKDNDAFLSLKNEETGQTALRFFFDKGQLLYQNNKGKTFYTTAKIKEKEWITMGWSSNKDYYKLNTFYYINGTQVGNDGEGALLDKTKNYSLEFTKGTGNWDMNNLIFWSGVATTELKNAPLVTPKATGANLKGLFLFNEGAGQKMLNDKISGSGITVNGTGDCTTSWTTSTYQPNATLDFNNTVLSTNQSNNTLKIKKGELTTAFTIEFWSVNEMSLYFKELPLTMRFKSNGELYYSGNTGTFYDKFPLEYFKSWHHWAITYTTSSKELTLFKDGVKLKTYKRSEINLDSDLLKKISEVSITGGGNFDELRIWNTIRTEKEIKDNYRYRMENVNCGSNLLVNEHFDKEPTKAAILLTDKKDCQGNIFNKVSKQILALDGTDDVIEDKVDVVNKSFTIEFWAKRKRNTIRRLEYVIGIGGQSRNDNINIGYESPSGNFSFSLENTYSIDKKYTDDKWHHWACVYDITKQEQIVYQDGVEVGKNTNVKPYKGSSTVWVGKAMSPRIGITYEFMGNLMEVRIWEGIRTAAEINAHKDFPLTGNCQNLLLYYDFDKVKNNELVNLASQKKATLQNFGSTPFVADFVEFKNTAKDGCTPPSGSVDYTLSLNGQSDYVTTSQDIDLNNKPFTIEFWAKRDVDNKKQVIVSHADNLEIGFDANNKCYALLRLSNGTYITAKTASDNNWHHYIYVYDHTYSSHFIFIDGQINAKGTNYKYEKSGKLLLGRNPSGNHPFGGEIDELRVWNKALYPNYIKQNYRAKYPNTEKDLLAYYNFNDGKGTILTDVKSGNNGTISTVKNVSLAWKKSTKPVKLNPPQPTQNAYHYGNGTFSFRKIGHGRTNSTIMFWLKSGRSGTMSAGNVISIKNYKLQVANIPAITITNKWEHYTLVVGYDGCEVFRNGKSIGKGSINYSWAIDNIQFNNNISVDDLIVVDGRVLTENKIKDYISAPPVMNSTMGDLYNIVQKSGKLIYYNNSFDNGIKGDIKNLPSPTNAPSGDCAIHTKAGQHRIEMNAPLGTLEFWFKADDLMGKETIVEIPSSSGTSRTYYYLLQIDNGRLSVNDDIMSGPLTPSKWNHIAISCRKKPSAQYRHYVVVHLNGKSLGQKEIYLAQESHKGTGMIFNPNKTWDAKFDEIKLWSIIRSDAEVQSDMTSTSIPISGMSHYYKCNECSGTTLKNSMYGGGGSNATIHDSTDNPFGQAGPKK